MPSCTIYGKRPLRDGTILTTARRAVILTEGDRFCILDPATDNELVKGATKSFIDTLIRKGYLTVDNPV